MLSLAPSNYFEVYKVTGFELGSGMDINTALPDETVKFMRQVIVCCHR